MHFVAKALLFDVNTLCVEIVWEMAAIEGPKHAKCVHQKLHFWKFIWTVCSTMQSTVESMMTRMMSTEFRLGVAETACRVGVLCADSNIHACPRGNITALRL